MFYSVCSCSNKIIFIQHAFNEAMYLVEQADDDKDGMVTS